MHVGSTICLHLPVRIVSGIPFLVSRGRNAVRRAFHILFFPPHKVSVEIDSSTPTEEKGLSCCCFA